MNETLSRAELRKAKRIPWYQRDIVRYSAMLIMGALLGASIWGLGKVTSPDFDRNVSIGSDFGYSTLVPEGWNVESTDDNTSSVETKRNPLLWYSKSCSLTQITVFLPSKNKNRGDEYLSKNLSYSIADNLRVEDFKTSQGKLNINGSKEPATIMEGKNFLGVSRVFGSESMKVPKNIKLEDTHGVETETEKGLPSFTSYYMCNDEDDFSRETAEKIISTVKISSSDK